MLEKKIIEFFITNLISKYENWKKYKFILNANFQKPNKFHQIFPATFLRDGTRELRRFYSQHVTKSFTSIKWNKERNKIKGNEMKWIKK